MVKSVAGSYYRLQVARYRHILRLFQETYVHRLKQQIGFLLPLHPKVHRHKYISFTTMLNTLPVTIKRILTPCTPHIDVHWRSTPSALLYTNIHRRQDLGAIACRLRRYPRADRSITISTRHTTARRLCRRCGWHPLLCDTTPPVICRLPVLQLASLLPRPFQSEHWIGSPKIWK